ncbi:RICIN domain-containing protein [Amycolatopsis lurida]
MTFRELEGKASASGDVLPSSTIASALGRSTLPREQIVAALVRACGLGEVTVQDWLSVRRRIAMGEPDAPPTWTETEPLPAPGPVRRPPAARVGLVLVAMLAVLSFGVYLVVSDQTRDQTREQSPSASAGLPIPGLTMGTVGSWVTIRAAAAAGLCLSEGRDSTGSYEHAVAALRPCDQAVPPRTFMRPISTGLVQIQWHHAVHGVGCLTVRTDGVGKDLVEPWDDCSESRSAQVFRLSPAGPPDSRRYRLQPTHSDMCIGIAGKQVVANREARHGPCTGQADQEYVIDLVPPP